MAETADHYFGDRFGTTIYGIESESGPLFPGLSNSFHIYEKTAWFRKNRYVLFFITFFVAPMAAVILHISISYANDRALDNIALSLDLGDIVTRARGGSTVEVDEVFGNEYVKDKKVAENSEDPRIAGAENPYAASATLPVDLNPEIIPEYPPEARSSGVQGTLTLEIVVSEDGKMLRARPVGRTLGHGLEEAAVAAYYKKNFRPSLREGSPITVKYLQPVRFVLN